MLIAHIHCTWLTKVSYCDVARLDTTCTLQQRKLIVCLNCNLTKCVALGAPTLLLLPFSLCAHGLSPIVTTTLLSQQLKMGQTMQQVCVATQLDQSAVLHSKLVPVKHKPSVGFLTH